MRNKRGITIALTRIPIALEAGVLFLGSASLCFAQDWSVTSAPKAEWYSIASSADGSKLLAIANPDGVYVSTDGATNWTRIPAPVTGDIGYLGAAVSGDGTVMMAVGPGVYLSSNSGADWALQKGSIYDNVWNAAGCSADGRKLIAVGGSGVLCSTDSGVTWTNYSNPYAFFEVASSADGSRLVAGCMGSAAGIYTSTNSGATWTKTSLAIWPAGGLACSADGMTLLAASRAYSPPGGTLNISRDFGVTWTETSTPLQWWEALASSANGRTLLAVGITNHLSSDSGLTWSPIGPQNGYIHTGTLTPDGSKILIASQGGASSAPYDGTIYLRQSIPQPALEIRLADPGVVLAWYVPSRPFRLQSRPTLATASWSEVTASFLPNWTTLKYEAAMPKPSATTFYRLKSE